MDHSQLLADKSKSLPRYIALSNGYSRVFMEYIHEDVPARGLFIFQGDEVLSPFNKLEVVDAGNGRVHIRCCYNNKFLALRSENDLRISPVADEPVTDQSAWSCTMFTVKIYTSNLADIVHVHRQRSLHCSNEDQVCQINTTTVASPMFKLHDVSSMLALNLPRFVVFTGDNGYYVRPEPNDIVACGTPGGSDWNIKFLHEIKHDADGFVRIRNVGNDRFWRVIYDPPLLFAHSTGSNPSNLPPGHNWIDTCFSVVRLAEDNVVALLSPDRHRYLMRGGYNLIPATTSIIPEARLVMEEAVKSRDIYNVKFNVLDSKTRIEGASSISTQTVINQTSVQQESELTFTYSETKTSNWNATVSATLGLDVSITAGIPFLAKTEFTFSAEVSGSYEWGKEYSETITKEDKLHIKAPPMTTVSATRIETRGSFDMPFSYTQEDVLWDGKSVIAQKDDGLYLGANTSDIEYTIREKPITSTAVVSDTQSEKVGDIYRILPYSSRIVPPACLPNDPSLESTPAVPAG